MNEQLETEKLKLEKNKLAVSALIEDFKARWQELLNFENENSRWQTLYVTALILVIGWILGNSGEDGKYKSIHGIFKGDNAFLLLALAFINTIYTLAMAYKGYQIQEIAQYLYSKIGKSISEKTGCEFNSWERWRRNEAGKPKMIRKVFYSVVSAFPTIISGVILFLYWNLEYSLVSQPREARCWINLVFWIVVVFVFVSFGVSVYTTLMNAVWKKIFDAETSAGTERN